MTDPQTTQPTPMKVLILSAPVECWECKKCRPAICYVNIMNAAAGGVASVMKPVCVECAESRQGVFAR